MQVFTSFFVQLDPNLQNLIGLAATFVVTYLLLQLAAISPVLSEYLGQYKVGIVTWLTGLAVELIQGQLNQIPASWDAVVVVAQRLIVEVVFVLLSMSAIRAKKWAGHAALTVK